MITIVDYDLGNIGSIANMLKRIGVGFIVSKSREHILSADKIILPGVGSFDKGMNALERYELVEPLKETVIVNKTPILGICLGMQLLTKTSEEGELDGLGFVDAKVKKFSFDLDSKHKVPHMGWNFVNVKKENPLLSIEEKNKFYFVHSYYVECNEVEDILGVTDYGIEFTSTFQKNNIFGTQFHPEKSHKYGLKLLTNFSKI